LRGESIFQVRFYKGLVQGAHNLHPFLTASVLGNQVLQRHGGEEAEMRVLNGALIGLLLLLVPAGPAAAAVISLDPSRTFYHTDSIDSGADSIPIDLASLGIVGGDLVALRMRGDFCYYFFPGCTESFFGAGAVFVNDSTLLDRNQPDRVVGAIDAGEDFVTPLTYFQHDPTDIPEDFYVGSSFDVVVEVPIGATHLFVAPSDSFWGDNRDLDGNFALSISIVPEPSTVALLGVGLLSLVLRQAGLRDTDVLPHLD
jgi:hypothetical protein